MVKVWGSQKAKNNENMGKFINLAKKGGICNMYHCGADIVDSVVHPT